MDIQRGISGNLFASNSAMRLAVQAAVRSNWTVNGTVINASLPFAPTGSFSTWSNSSATASLVAGTNKIRLTSIGSNGPNVDHLVIDQTAPPTTLEAEDAVLSGPAVASNQPGYTGTGFADYANASGDYVEWTYNAATAGSYSLNFRYALGGSGGRPLQLTVNGTVINASLPFAPTGSFSTWSTSSATANLVAGVNKIRLTTIGSNGPNMDNVVIEKNNLRSIQYIQRSMPERNVLSTGSDLLKASILPNPVVSNNAKLIVSTSSNLPISFQLVDMLGRSYGSPGLMKSGSNTVDLSVHGLPAGSYIVVIKQGAQTTQARLVIGAY